MGGVKIAIVGGGIFVRTQYIPRLSEIKNLISLSVIWSRSQETASAAVEIASKHFTGVQCKWGEEGLLQILQDPSILAVAVVLAAQSQVDISLRLLKAGKHVLQEKPAAASITEIESALLSYKSIAADVPGKPIWAIAENYRFEPGLLECKKLVAEIGDIMNVQLIVEGSMNSANPYFSSSWRRKFTGGFIVDMGVHFIAGLRMLVGCEVSSVSAITSHVDLALPPPDNISSVFQLENGSAGIFVMVVSSKSPKILWRIVGLKGTVEVERGKQDGQHGYLASIYGVDGQRKSSFHPFSGVTDELKTFLHDVSQSTLEQGSNYEADSRLSYYEGARDFAVLEAMLESGMKHGAVVQVKKF
ncbi:hypothetical protein K2173_008788 [Erythroxylum novogranatense]|uniref:Oxidoreductase n=1 Tax=Erythroxylum novogranatense TaxID=1862640 RepID=A0AAV8SYP7_9ROSI|nr:hypothetical protein K2173_008788 [Erythroxylum novogranatense]